MKLIRQVVILPPKGVKQSLPTQTQHRIQQMYLEDREKYGKFRAKLMADRRKKEWEFEIARERISGQFLNLPRLREALIQNR